MSDLFREEVLRQSLSSVLFMGYFTTKDKDELVPLCKEGLIGAWGKVLDLASGDYWADGQREHSGQS